MNNNNKNTGEIQNLDMAKEIINYLYSTIDLSKFKYKIIEYESDLLNLTKQKHYVSANFNGNNCLLIFTKIKDNYYSLMVDRKTLTYSINQIKLNSIKMYPVNIRLDNSIYDGTIIDGIFVLNKKSKSKVFIITDVYYFRGKNMMDDNIQHKFMNVTTYLENNFKHDDKMNNLILTINKLYEPTNINKLVDDMERSKGYDFRGYVFYPDKSGTKLIFLNTDEDEVHTIENVKQNIKEITDQGSKKENMEMSKRKKKFKYVCKLDGPIYSTLEIRKTDFPDVYYVYCADKEIINNKNMIKIKKLGIALIPDKNTSVICKNILNSKINGKALMKCQFNSDKSKWIPLEESKSNKIPTMLYDIEKELEIVVYSDSDEEE